MQCDAYGCNFGKATCSGCNGSGKNPYNVSLTCSSCNGMGRTNCWTCGGNGTRSCDNCGGTGMEKCGRWVVVEEKK
ncbi:MAG: hypothetical protein HYY17_08225 [Planctomycetes bacterium]|nr:hypothetical protein [Planctomycetota bacterium]